MKDLEFDKHIEEYLTRIEEKVLAKNNKKRSNSVSLPVPPPLEPVVDEGISVEELLSDIKVSDRYFLFLTQIEPKVAD